MLPEVKTNLEALSNLFKNVPFFTSIKMSPHPQGKGWPLGTRWNGARQEIEHSQERVVGTCAWAADPKGLRLAVQERVVFQAAANVAAGARIVNVVHYFFRGGHGNHWKHDRKAVKWEHDRDAVK